MSRPTAGIAVVAVAAIGAGPGAFSVRVSVGPTRLLSPRFGYSVARASRLSESIGRGGVCSDEMITLLLIAPFASVRSGSGQSHDHLRHP